MSALLLTIRFHGCRAHRTPTGARRAHPLVMRTPLDLHPSADELELASRSEDVDRQGQQ